MILQTVPANLKGVIRLNSSKSNLIRLVIIASLSNCKTEICYNGELARDVTVVINALRDAGINILVKKTKIIVVGNTFKTICTNFNCQDSGAAFRFLVPLFLLKLGSFSLSGSPRLIERISLTSLNFFKKNNIEFIIKDNTVFLSGNLNKKIYEVELDKTSQYASGLLMVLPFLKDEKVKMAVFGNTSYSYLKHTIYLLSLFKIKVNVIDHTFSFINNCPPVKKLKINAESDLSLLPFYLFLSHKFPVEIKKLMYTPHSSDYAIFSILDKFNLATFFRKNKLALTTSKTNLSNKIEIDFLDCPDLVLPVVIFSIYLNTNITLLNIQNLQYKESNRLEFIISLLKETSKQFSLIHADDKISLEIGSSHNPEYKDFKIDCFSDHRSIMSCILLSYLLQISITIKNAKGINKSDANFLSNYKKLGAVIRCLKN